MSERQFLIDINPEMELPKYQLILYKLQGIPIASLKNITGFNYKAFFIGTDEISFNIPAYRNDDDGSIIKNEIYDMVDGEYYILLNDKKFFIIDKIDEKADDDGNLYKSVHAYSREYELTWKKLVDYRADSRVLYDSDDSTLDGIELGILNYIFKHVTKSWTIGEIDADVLIRNGKNIHRSLNFPNTNLLQVFQELQKTFNCIFKFNTKDCTIDIVSMDADIGQNKGLFISNGNFIKSISKSIKYDDVKTRLFVYGKDNISIQSISPTGQSYLDNFDAFKRYMTQGLIDALESYQLKTENYNPDFEPLLTQLQEANQVMEDLINKDHAELNQKGMIALERALSNTQTLIDVKAEESAITRKAAESATGEALTGYYADLKAIQSALDGYETEKTNIKQLINSKQTEIDNQQIVIDGIKQQMQVLQRELDAENPDNFTPEQLKELDKFIRVETYNDSNYTENNIVELYEEGQKMLRRISQPAINFDVDIVNFLNIVECQHIWNKFILGDYVNLQHREMNFDFEVRLVSYEHDVDSNRLNLKFSNTNSFDDATLWMRDLLEEINTTATAVDFNKDKWYGMDYIDSVIAKRIDTKLEQARQNILSAVGQKYLHDDSGLWLYKENPDGSISPEQIRAINNTIGLTEDNWNTVGTAITPKGVVAEKIYGKIIEGVEVSADTVKTGILKSADGSTQINLDDGSFNFKDALKWENNELVISGLESGGSQIFNAQPTTPYKLNDLWKVTGIAGVDFKICTTARASGSYVASDWTNVTDSKNYADAIKNLTAGTAIAGGNVTIDRGKIRINHSSGIYSQFDINGVYKQYANGRGNYLNGIHAIYVENFIKGSDNRTPYVYVDLPTHFKGRGSEIEIVIIPGAMRWETGKLRARDDITWLTYESESYIRHNLRLSNLDANIPYIAVRSEVKELWIHRKDGEGMWYHGMDFVVLVIGR